MFSGIRRFFRKLFFTNWQHVGLFEYPMRFGFDDWELYIHCYESQHGDRRIEIIGCRPDASGAKKHGNDLEEKFKITKLYQTELYPWLKGRIHGKIPGYELVKSEKFDFTQKLKGKAPIILNDDEKKA